LTLGLPENEPDPPVEIDAGAAYYTPARKYAGGHVKLRSLLSFLKWTRRDCEEQLAEL